MGLPVRQIDVAQCIAGTLAGLTPEQCRWLLSYTAQQASGVSCWMRDPSHVEKAFAVTVSDLMTKDHVHTAVVSESLHDAAKTMAKENVSMLPVLDGDTYAGVITRGHVVAALDRLEFGGGSE